MTTDHITRRTGWFAIVSACTIAGILLTGCFGSNASTKPGGAAATTGSKARTGQAVVSPGAAPMIPVPPGSVQNEAAVQRMPPVEAPAAPSATATPATSAGSAGSPPAGTAEQQPKPRANEPAATRPADAKAIAPYARERYRLVHGEDEIVSVLENGAVIISKRVVGSPVLAVRGYVRTGGAFEGKWLGGGLSHLLEHLVAGGSNSRHSEAQSREILQQLGNNSNAYTTDDHTAYFINTTPANLEKAVDLLTGWLLHASITEDEFRREHQVVRRELEMGRGDPTRQFYYMVENNRYHVSPAGIPVIGYWEVIQGLSRDDVFSYYRQAYQPNNMIFSVAGDLTPEAMLQMLQRYIDAPPGRVFDRAIPAEPSVLAPRTLVATASKIGEARVNIAYPTIALDHPDLYALDLLAAVLGQSEGSVLTREIRDDKKLVSSISSYSYTPAYVDGSFGVSLQCPADKLDPALEAVQLVLDRAKREPLDQQTIDRARMQMRVNHLRQQQQTENIASDLASSYMSTGDIHFTSKYLERLAKVSAADLQAAARKYLDNQRLIKTVMLPAESTQAKGLPAAEQFLRKAGEQASTTTAAPEAKLGVSRSELPNGTVLLVRRVPTSPLIAVRMYALGGLTAESEKNNGIGNVTMKMLERGTTFRSATQLSNELEAMGADIETSCGNNSWYWNASMLKEDFEKGMEIFADVVKNPAFAGEELNGVRDRTLARIAEQDSEWTAQTMRYFKQKFYPANSPYRLQVIGTENVVSSLRPEDLRNWYQQQVLPARRVLAIYGDIDPQAAMALANKLLGNGPQTHSAPPARSYPAVPVVSEWRPQADVVRVEVQHTDKALAGVAIGYETQSVIGDPTTDALSIADTMTSGWGYPTGYLHETLRGQGLVYIVHGQNWPGRSIEYPGTFFVLAGCQPEKVNTVVDEILLNVARLQGTPQDIQPDWFARSKDLLVTDEAMSNETVAEQATTAALDELWGLGFDYHERFPQRVKAVSLADVQRLAASRLQRCVVTISTPAPEAVTIRPGVRTYESFPPVELTPKGVQHEMPLAK